MRRLFLAFAVSLLAACAQSPATPPASGPSSSEALVAVPVFFDTDSAELTLVASSALERAVERLKAEPRLLGRIEGYADPRGSAADNIALSAKRAMAVRDFLVAWGIAPNRLSVVALGAESSSIGAEALARRVVLRLE
jgi:peptidoglycan-associated lipoprotein